MKLPFAPIQRTVLALAVAAIVTASIGAVAIVTQPASATDDGTTTEMTLVEPATDEPTTTTTEPVTLVTIAAQALGAPDRAENAAVRAEVAATRSEVAAVKAETIINSTTTTVLPSSTITTMTDRPILVDMTQPTIPTTTTTTVPPKTWVEVASFPLGSRYDKSLPPPVTKNVELSGAPVRVTGLPVAPTVFAVSGESRVWLDGKIDLTDATTWAAGPHTLTAATWDPGVNNNTPGWRAPYAVSDRNTAAIIIEEYR